MRITDRGFAMQIDSIISISIILLFLLVSFAKLSSISSSSQMQSSIEAEFFASSLSEAIVKNRNEENPALGSAYYNPLLRRIESNVIDEALLSKVQPSTFGKYSLSAIYLSNLSGPNSSEKNYFFGSSVSDCIAIERFVMLKGLTEKTSVLGVVVCEK